MYDIYLILSDKDRQRICLPYIPQVGEEMEIPFEQPGVGGDVYYEQYLVTKIKHQITYDDERCLRRIHHFTEVYLDLKRKNYHD